VRVPITVLSRAAARGARPARGASERAGEAEALNGLGEVLLATAQPGPAHVRHAGALALASDISNRNEQARAHNGLGAALLAEGLTSQARAHYAAALALASESGDPYRQDRARDGLAFSERAYA
jgi:Flp pilus assembly protein TadD